MEEVLCVGFWRVFLFRGFVCLCRFLLFIEFLFVCRGFVFVVVVCPPQRDLGLFLMSFESPCGGLSLQFSCI